MRITLDIQDGKALAFLNFVQSLDFVTINSEESANEKDFVLSDEQLNLLEERRNDRIQGKSQTYSWDEVTSLLKNRSKKIEGDNIEPYCEENLIVSESEQNLIRERSSNAKPEDFNTWDTFIDTFDK